MKIHRLPHSRLRAGLARAPRRRIQRRELQVLRGVGDGLSDCDPWYGDLATTILGTQHVNWSVTVLVLHRLPRFGAFGFGPPQITAHGLRMLDSRVDLGAFGDQR